MRVFISHATADRDLANELVDLVRLGIGVPHDDIFYSSREGDIGNGSFFVPKILAALAEADLVIALLSRDYSKSEFCLAEAGAAQMRSLAHLSEFHSLVVPPMNFHDLKGVLHGMQSDLILAPGALNQLRDRISVKLPSVIPTATWENKRDSFLVKATSLVAERTAGDLADRICLADMQFEPASDPNANFRCKLRIFLRNKTGKTVTVRSASWASGYDGVRLQADMSPLKLQTKPVGQDWAKQPEAPSVSVADGRPFRVWIGLQVGTSAAEVLKRCATHKLGTLSLMLEIEGAKATKKFAL
jgi:hypothetical protein